MQKISVISEKASYSYLMSGMRAKAQLYNQPDNLKMKMKEKAACELDRILDFFNETDDILFSYDSVHKRITHLSASCESLSGYEETEFRLNPRLWSDIIHPDFRHRIRDYQHRLKSGKPFTVQYCILRQDGALRWVDKTMMPRLDQNGRLSRIDGIIRDITAYREAELSHRFNENRYQQMIETAEEGVWSIDEQERTNFVNKKMEDMLGYSAREMIGKKIYDFMDEEGEAYARKCMERRRSGLKEKIEMRYITKSGRDLWTSIAVNPLYDEIGRYKGALALVSDTSQQKLDKEVLEKSEANLRMVFEHTEMAYILFNDDFKILAFNSLANKNAEELHGMPLVVSRSIEDYIPAGRLESMKDLQRKIRIDSRAAYELSFPDDNGTLKWFHIRWIAIKNEEQKICGFIAVNKNITAAKNAEIQKEAITADIMLKNKNLEHFAYVVSHTLRAPVANIAGLAGLLCTDPHLSDDMREIISGIVKSANTIDVVIKDLNHALWSKT